MAYYPEPTDRQYEAQDGKIYTVRMDSSRYAVFRRGHACVACGVEGTTLLLQRNRDGNGRCHFNFYAPFGGGLLMMTKDHIVPRARGGTNDLDNLQTMCDICNFIKDQQDIGLDELRRQRKELEATCSPSPT